VNLLDVNALVALAWPNHVHHASARRWFLDHHAEGWATCPLTESGFVRVSTNARINPDARTVLEAATLLAALRAWPGHQFWLDDVSLAEEGDDALVGIHGHQQVTDAHLQMLAGRRGGRLVTFDREAAQLGKRLGFEALMLTP